MKVIVTNIEHVINLVKSHNIYFLKEQEPVVSSDSVEDPKEESLYVAGIQGNIPLTDLLVYLLESIIAGIIDDLPTNEESYPDQEEGINIIYSVTRSIIQLGGFKKLRGNAKL